jgi:hypothetical protein
VGFQGFGLSHEAVTAKVAVTAKATDGIFCKDAPDSVTLETGAVLAVQQA